MLNQIARLSGPATQDSQAQDKTKKRQDKTLVLLVDIIKSAQKWFVGALCQHCFAAGLSKAIRASLAWRVLGIPHWSTACIDPSQPVFD